MRPRWKHAARPVGFVYVLIPSIIPARAAAAPAASAATVFLLYILYANNKVSGVLCAHKSDMFENLFFFFVRLLYFLRFQSDLNSEIFFTRNKPKFKVLASGMPTALVVNKTDQHNTTNVKIKDETVDQVKQFFYSGSLITTNNRSTKEINRRIAIAKQTFEIKSLLLINKNLNITIRKSFIKTYIRSIFYCTDVKRES